MGLIDHLGVVDGVATEPKLGYNAVKLRVECEEIWKIPSRGGRSNCSGFVAEKWSLRA